MFVELLLGAGNFGRTPHPVKDKMHTVKIILCQSKEKLQNSYLGVMPLTTLKNKKALQQRTHVHLCVQDRFHLLYIKNVQVNPPIKIVISFMN